MKKEDFIVSFDPEHFDRIRSVVQVGVHSLLRFAFDNLRDVDDDVIMYLLVQEFTMIAQNPKIARLFKEEEKS